MPPHAPARAAWKRWAGWLLRCAGLLLVVFLLRTKVHWEDRVTAGDQVFAGTVERVDTDHVLVRSDAGTVERLSFGGDEGEAQPRPKVAYGLRSVGRRLAAHPWRVALMLVALLGLILLTAWRWQGLVRALGLSLRLPAAMALTLIGGFFNLVVPGSTGGDVVKAWAAVRATGAGTRAVLSVFVDRIVGLFGLIVLAAGVLFWQRHQPGYAAARWLVCFAGLGAIALFIVLGSTRIRRALRLGALLRRLPGQRLLGELGAGISLYAGQPRALLGALLLSLINHAGAAFAVAGFAHAMGIEGATPLACLAVVPVANLVSAVPLAPGGWGVGEWAFATFFAPLGVPATEAVALSITYRLALVLVNTPGGALWAFWRHPKDSDKIRAEVEQATSQLDLATPHGESHA